MDRSVGKRSREANASSKESKEGSSLPSAPIIGFTSTFLLLSTPLIPALPISMWGAVLSMCQNGGIGDKKQDWGARDYVAERAFVEEVLRNRRQVSVSHRLLGSRSHHADSRTSDDSDDGIRGYAEHVIQPKKHAKT